ncbi:HAD-like domain [Trinorchestia longiramus]|nr:HAD-like domain [Trinorchestia longiramus]
MTSYSPVTHVIFDMDGLLLDTERLYSIATNELAAEYGKTYTWDVKVKCMGMKGDASSKIIVDSLGLPLTVEEYMEKIEIKYKEVFPLAALLPDSVGSYLMIHQEVLAGYGLTCTWYDLIQLMGHTAYETAEEICRLKSVPDTPENYRDKVAEHQRNTFFDMGLMRGGLCLVGLIFPFFTSFSRRRDQRSLQLTCTSAWILHLGTPFFNCYLIYSPQLLKYSL